MFCLPSSVRARDQGDKLGLAVTPGNDPKEWQWLLHYIRYDGWGGSVLVRDTCTRTLTTKTTAGTTIGRHGIRFSTRGCCTRPIGVFVSVIEAKGIHACAGRCYPIFPVDFGRGKAGRVQGQMAGRLSRAVSHALSVSLGCSYTSFIALFHDARARQTPHAQPSRTYHESRKLDHGPNVSRPCGSLRSDRDSVDVAEPIRR